MNSARPALRVDRARLANARAGDRARLTSALAMASPAATGVAERALLLVRRLRVDRPLGVGVEGFAGELIDRIRAAKTNARRGAIGSGESLYFEDEIALECALVAAWLGAAPLPELVRSTIPDSETPLLRWRRRIWNDPRQLPRLIAALVEAGTAGAWLARFEQHELRAACALLLRTNGGDAGLADAGRGEARIMERGSAPPPHAAQPPAAIERAFARARTATPDPTMRALIAVALLAARRPELVATEALAKALVAAFEAPAPSSPSTPADAVGAAAARVPGSRASKAAVLEQGSSPRTGRLGEQDRPPVEARRSLPRRSTAVRTWRIARSGSGDPEPAFPRMQTVAPAAIDARAIVNSDHAGLFFLLNIFLALGLYGDFTDPVRQVRGLSPFELLLLLARRWVGAAFVRDPLEPVLRSLAGLAARERPGRNFEAPVWRVPPDWLAPWPAGPARGAKGGVSVSRWHAAGFPLADQWCEARPAAWMRRRWVTCLARYIEARLARALGSDDRAEAVAMLVRRRGTVHLDGEQIEVAFDLDTHPLPIRLAGLDRDPGWIPAAARTISFGFA